MILLGTIENNLTTEIGMATQENRKVGGAKTSRSETVTVRLEPQLRYLAEIAARAQRRTLSSYIEGAVEESLKNVTLKTDKGEFATIAELRQRLWDVEESDRFLTLFDSFPELLTHDEQILNKLHEEFDELWGPKGEEMDPDKDAFRRWFTMAKFAVSTGAEVELIRTALRGDAKAMKAIGLDKFVEDNEK